MKQAAEGQGQVVGVSGEAGVGKTRLFYEFTRNAAMRDWLLIETDSVSYGKATAYLPVIGLLKGYCQIEERDDNRSIREKVSGKLVTLDQKLMPILPALLSLLDVPVDDPEWVRIDPPQRRERTLEAIKQLLVREARVQPVCCGKSALDRLGDTGASGSIGRESADSETSGPDQLSPGVPAHMGQQVLLHSIAVVSTAARERG